MILELSVCELVRPCSETLLKRYCPRVTALSGLRENCMSRSLDALNTGDKDFAAVDIDRPEILTPTEFLSEYRFQVIF